MHGIGVFGRGCHMRFDDLPDEEPKLGNLAAVGQAALKVRIALFDQELFNCTRIPSALVAVASCGFLALQTA